MDEAPTRATWDCDLKFASTVSPSGQRDPALRPVVVRASSLPPGRKIIRSLLCRCAAIGSFVPAALFFQSKVLLRVWTILCDSLRKVSASFLLLLDWNNSPAASTMASAGRPAPFDGISLVELAKKVSMDGLRLPPPAGAPLPLLQMMARCWATKPARRPEFEQLLVALRQLFHELQAESAKLRQQAAEAGAEQGP